MNKIKGICVSVLLLFIFCVSGCGADKETEAEISVSDVPEFSGEAYVEINNNNPTFSEEESNEEFYESYGTLDSLGRCSTASANISAELMPTEKRGSIGEVKPSGWHTVKYDCVDGKYLYNRCHLIGYQLTAENANEKNLITGTRYLNVEGMLPFENMVADYIKETNNHVLYRVTPIFEGSNLVASGVQMEAKSVEDDGEGILFNVYCYNVQPGVEIDYASGESEYVGEESSQNSQKNEEDTYILNTNTHKFHLFDCASLETMKESNKSEVTESREELIRQGYDPCKQCNP
ncbi:MAG: DNA/RNA non-specific endonuclease [Lachnospiraceae bacterium]|nr:DNA/RNA non-specific endonuclease [Lachnospiraceae bacterium]